ncbi:MAG: prolyl oligopeptidase family serine peptidase [Methanotrichaceae archaeon]|nr:prolyl oligopeptidase family serine peptidase [Methanotrichaceae archaeon]
MPVASCQQGYVDYSQAEQFLPASVVPTLYNMSVTPNWIEGTHYFWYLHDGRDGKNYVLVDMENATKTPAFDHRRLAEALALVSGAEVDPSDLALSNLTFRNGKILFSVLNRTWQYDLKDHFIEKVSTALSEPRFFKFRRHDEPYIVTEIRAIAAAKNGELLSPNGKLTVYVEDHNLWLKETGTGDKYRLTSDGSKDYAYAERSGTVLHPVSVARLNETTIPYAVWSPDSRKIATFRMDQRNVTPLYLLEYVPDSDSRPRPWEYRFAMPGEEHVPIYEPVIIDVLDKTVLPVSYEPQPEVSLMDTDSDVLQWWSDDGRTLYSLFAERGEKALRLLETDPQTGQTRVLLQESGPTYVEANLDYASLPNARILKNGDVVWFSEKSGYGHLYLYDSDGRQKNAITRGDWAVRTLLHVDENRSLVYFTAGGREPGRDPYFRHLYRVNLNGSELTLLTPENADHSIQMSPDGSAFVDTYSRVDLPPVSVLRGLSGNVTLTLEEGDIRNLTDMGWKPPEVFSIKALDGKTDLYGLLIKPTGFNASKKYPVVETVYPGPWTIVTSKSFPGDQSWVNKIFWRGQALSELGFVVVTIDGPGTPYRSKEFHDASYGHLGDAGGLSDHVNALEVLAKERPYMDLNRVGMFGHSAGGFMTAQALLSYPGFYKVGVASSGDYDSRFYGSFWGEKYEGLDANYTEQVTSRKAGNLTGDLLLITGDVDDNVNPCMTMQMVNAFIEADRPFDLLVMTNRNHDLSYDPYYIHRLFDYFEEHLQNNCSNGRC